MVIHCLRISSIWNEINFILDMKLNVHFYQGGGVGIAHFNMATGGVAGGKTAEVRLLTAYILPYYLKTESI